MMDIGYYIIKLNKYLKSVFSVVGKYRFFCATIHLYYLKRKINTNIFIEINCIDNKILNTKYLCAMIINRMLLCNKQIFVITIVRGVSEHEIR